jgi:hypothetical protein
MLAFQNNTYKTISKIKMWEILGKRKTNLEKVNNTVAKLAPAMHPLRPRV